MRYIQEYHYRLLYFREVELLFNRETQEDSVSRTDYKLLFLERNAFKDRKIQNSTKSVQEAF